MKYLLVSFFQLMSLISISQSTDTTYTEANNNCDFITKEVDEFSGEKTFTAKVAAKNGDDISFIKVIKGKSEVYYLSIWIKESGIYTGTGVSIILKNGKRINKPNEKVDYNYSAGDFYTTAFIRLNPSDIQLLKQSGISKYKLYISQGEVESFSDLSKDYFNCLTKSK